MSLVCLRYATAEVLAVLLNKLDPGCSHHAAFGHSHVNSTTVRKSSVSSELSEDDRFFPPLPPSSPPIPDSPTGRLLVPNPL